MRILFLGDMVGKPARRAVVEYLRKYKKEKHIDVVIANSDNLAHGRSVTRRTVEEMLSSGVDILTCGDHAWDNTQAFDILKSGDLNFICPCNLPDLDFRLSGKIFEVGGTSILVINLLGRVFIDKDLVSPFEVVEKIIEKNKENEKADIVILDFHAEATSEKKAMGRFLKGKVSAVLGTHTHVQTADEEILKGGTAYLTDAGMVGVEDSILGCEEKAVLDQFTKSAPFKYKLAEDSEVTVQGAIIDIDEKNGRALKIERVREQVFIED